MGSADDLRIAMKNTGEGPKFGIQYVDEDKFKEAAAQHRLRDQTVQGSYKVTGIGNTVGCGGFYMTLEDQGWGMGEIEYLEGNHAVVLAEEPPSAKN